MLVLMLGRQVLMHLHIDELSSMFGTEVNADLDSSPLVISLIIFDVYRHCLAAIRQHQKIDIL